MPAGVPLDNVIKKANNHQSNDDFIICIKTLQLAFIEHCITTLKVYSYRLRYKDLWTINSDDKV